MKRKLWLGSLLLVLALMIGFFINNKGQEVETIAAAKGNLDEGIEETGYIQASEEYDIQALESGRIVEISTRRGQTVNEGQIILTMQSIDMDIETGAINERIAATRTSFDAAALEFQKTSLSLQQARADLKRKQELVKAGAISQADYEETLTNTQTLEQAFTSQQNIMQGYQQQLDSLQAQRQDLEKKSQQLTVKSPIAGVLLLLNVKEGQLVSPGTVLAQVGTAGGLAVKTDILCDDMNNIKIGQTVEVNSTVLNNRPLYGRITEIYPEAHEEISALGVAQRRVTVISALGQNGLLKPGYEVQVKIITARKKDTLLLPREAVLVTDGDSGEVNQVIKNRIVKQKVKMGLKNQQYVEIVSGLKQGDMVVRDAGLELKAGSRVKVAAD
ncbi:MAG TPA: efflux RND transporter periplasmic adaptor subunit [Syntrophomonas sp.]|nr:efflux RND transporter periplasmic adaptor subunit [Syntrophomonas sp.]